MQRKNTIKIFVLMIISCILICSKTFASPKDIIYMQEVFHANNNNYNNGKASIVLTLVSPIGKLNFDINMESIIKPSFLSKGEIITTYTSLLGETVTIKNTTYVEEKTDGITVYYKQNDNWYKITNTINLPQTSLIAKMLTIDKLNSTDNLIKNANIIFDNNIQRKVTVNFNGKILTDIIKTSILLSLLSPEENIFPIESQEVIQEANNLAFDDIDDITATFTVDVNTMRIVAMESNLSIPLRNIVRKSINNFFDNITNDHKEVINRALESCSFSIHSVYTKYNKINFSDIKIPAEALNAKKL